jgi:hypothetical protein
MKAHNIQIKHTGTRCRVATFSSENKELKIGGVF